MLYYYTMEYNKKLQKVATDFYCENCEYKTRNKTNFLKHLNTTKHVNTTKYNEKLQKVATSFFLCKCGKKYKHRASLFNHKKRCEFIEELNEHDKDANNTKLIIRNDEQIDYKAMFYRLMDENKEFKDILVQQQNQIGELLPKIGNNFNTVNNVNQKLNINIFLNEQCKDALNIDDFVKNIDINLEDLDFTKNNGLSEGISNAIIENMNKLSLYERPLHCTDIKRETLYIKNDDNWEKDNNKTKIKKAIKDVSNKQFKSIKKWTDANPDFQENDSKQEYFAKVLSVLGKDSTNVDDKVIKKICNNSHIKNLIDK